MIHTLRNGLKFDCREGTSDFNSANACAYVDEYFLGKEDVRGKVCFDVGSHVGGVAVLLASKGAKVVAVEPVPDNAALIRRNAELNDLDITVIEKAMGDGNPIQMDYGWYGDLTADVHTWIGNTGLGLDGYENRFSVTVESITLQDLVDAYGLPYVVKIDCEGGEWHALAEPVAKDVQIYSGEHHPMVGGPDPDVSLLKGRADVLRLIGDSHHVTFSGPADGSAANFFARHR